MTQHSSSCSQAAGQACPALHEGTSTCRSAPATTLGSGPRNAATVFRHSVSTLTTPFYWRVVWLDALSVSTPADQRHDMTTGTQMAHKLRHTHSQIHTYAYVCLCLCTGALASTYALPTRVERRMLRFNLFMHPGGYPRECLVCNDVPVHTDNRRPRGGTSSTQAHVARQHAQQRTYDST